ncbi:hypothetical protein B9Z19DRAFT_1084818 [Tuber borchii]|uniref:Uncharacterized protein n=1 Tax=Tuber borchii TaxID=42251 RepID=A0A2T6ZRM1_TUBBO|nr:hypothetical protein B9Z19DRAFT_1084818 [Tuber borchii]
MAFGCLAEEGGGGGYRYVVWDFVRGGPFNYLVWPSEGVIFSDFLGRETRGIYLVSLRAKLCYGDIEGSENGRGVISPLCFMTSKESPPFTCSRVSSPSEGLYLRLWLFLVRSATVIDKSKGELIKNAPGDAHALGDTFIRYPAIGGLQAQYTSCPCRGAC